MAKRFFIWSFDHFTLVRKSGAMARIIFGLSETNIIIGEYTCPLNSVAIDGG
jgi:hypothetical protein